MASGASPHNSSHRPFWPEYKVKDKDDRNLYLIIGKDIIDENGVAKRVESWQEVIDFAVDNNALFYVQSFTVEYHFPWLFDAVSDPSTKVLCNRRGVPIAVRIRRKRTYWVIRCSVWGSDYGPDYLRNMRDFFEYVGAGVYTTPSSLGHHLMRRIFRENFHGVHTSLSIYAERYIREHCVGGIVQSPYIGSEYEELIELDKSSAYLSHWTMHPVGTAIRFKNGHCDNFATWFGKCEIEVHSELALGPFPIRKNKKARVLYPTVRGAYEGYLWKEQAMDCVRAGCTVRPVEGYGWFKLDSNQVLWAQYAYRLRQDASTEFAEKCSKAVAVGGIGHHGMRRERFYVVPEDRAPAMARAVIDDFGLPLRLYVVQEDDVNSAIMLHWNNYTISECNRGVYNFALPFAQEGRLVQMDYDSILVLEKDERHQYIAREDIKYHNVAPGTWLWELLHDVKIVGPRAFTSREKQKLPGVKK